MEWVITQRCGQSSYLHLPEAHNTINCRRTPHIHGVDVLTSSTP